MVDSSFAAALAFVLRWEGGLSDHPADHGGRTMKGVTQATYDAWRTARGQPRQDVARISDDELGAIYRESYWAAAFCDRLRVALDLVQFDTGVNMGPNRAVKILQATVGATADGACGPQTQAACDSCGLPEAVAKYCEIREGIYRHLAERPGQDVFLDGWLNRLDDLRAEADVPGFSRARGAPTEPVARIPDLAPGEPLEAWR
jgi:lysozyme family protein